MQSDGLNVLLVEDNYADANYTKEILKEASFPVNLYVVSDGVEALSFIYRQDQYAQAPRPDLILLDLNLPKVDGRDLLEVLKSDDTLQPVPVIILTGSYALSDRAYTLQRKASFYLPKPLNLAQFEQTMFELKVTQPAAREPVKQKDSLSFNHAAFRVIRKWLHREGRA